MSLADIQPQSMVVRLQTGEQLHYLDWEADPAAPGSDQTAPGSDQPAPGSDQTGTPIVLIHGLARTAWTWLPVARRLANHHPVVAPDLRGHGASDAPLNGYDLEDLALDMLTVVAAKGWGEAVDGPPVIAAGHGLGAMIAAQMALLQPASIVAVGLIDGGWEETAEATRMSPTELLAEIEDPPEVMASMEAYLADRRDFDPTSWDADQETAARAQVNEKHAGHVRPITKASVMRRVVEAMYTYRPVEVLSAIPGPLLALVASAGTADDEEERERLLALDDVNRARARAERSLMRVRTFAVPGHDLMRYEPTAVAQALSELSRA